MSTAKQKPMALWQPRALVVRAQQLPRDQFVALHASPFYMVLVLGPPTCELALGLQQSGADSSRADGLAFRTEWLVREGPPSRTFVGPTSSTSTKRSSAETVARLLEMLDLSCYVLPLQKRTEGSFLTVISVGRSRNHDIVLRHPSVSKYHASLEILDGELFVKDAGSRNHTYLNHERVITRTRVQSGDNLRFGWVEGIACTSRALWNAARSGT